MPKDGSSPPSGKVILAIFHLALSKKSILRVVAKINDGPEFLDAPCLAGKNTVEQPSDRTVNLVSEDEESSPVNSRDRTR